MTLLRRLLLTAGLFAALAPGAAGDDPTLSRAAYSALQADPDLADRNIGVRVRDGGTAVLWGTATKAEVAKAEALLKTLPGITKVTSTCDMVGAPDPLVVRVEAGVRQRAAAEPARTKPEVKKPDPLPAGSPVSRHTTAEKPHVVRSASAEPAARLLDPVGVAGPVDYAAVERLRRSDPRFARLTFDLRDGRVVISGSASEPAAAWDLARKVAPLVGDRDVVVGRVGR